MKIIDLTPHETEIQAARRLSNRAIGQGFKPEALHKYTDSDGNALHWIVRLKNPATGDKWIRHMRMNEGVYELKGVEYPEGRPLYNLHRLTHDQSQTVWLVEGEKCADALTRLGLLATTTGGADSAAKADLAPLQNRDVVIWPDNDAPGERYAIEVISRLLKVGARVKLVDIEHLDLPEKADCVDWIEQFRESKGRDAEIADIEGLPQKTDFTEGATSDYLDPANTQALPHPYSATVSLHCAADIQPAPIDWLWNGWLAKGKLHIFAGAAGTGKTTIALALASTITKGGRFPDGSPSPAGSVLIWSGEDSAADTLVPRLMAAGADLSKVHFIGETTANHEVTCFDPSTDMHPLMMAATNLSDLALLIVDPIVNAVAGDSHKNGEVRRALQPVVDFGEKLNCAVLGITHFSKGGQGKDPLERVTGSLAFGALARVVLATAKITEGGITRRIVCRAKSNIGADSGGFEYDLQQREVQSGIFSSYALWGEAVEGSARELLAEPDNREATESDNSALDDAMDFLRDLLADGELPQKQIEADAKGAGHAWRTVRRAKDELGIRSVKSKLDKCWYWKLGSNMANTDEGVQHVHINYMDALDTLPGNGQLDSHYPDDVAGF